MALNNFKCNHLMPLQFKELKHFIYTHAILTLACYNCHTIACNILPVSMPMTFRQEVLKLN